MHANAWADNTDTQIASTAYLFEKASLLNLKYIMIYFTPTWSHLLLYHCVPRNDLSIFHIGMIIVPTRELALQTSQIAIELSKHMGVKVMVISLF